MKIVILYSGGLDSLIMYHLAGIKYPGAEIKCLYYRHGADSEIKEIQSLPSYVEVRNIDWLTDTKRPVAKQSDPVAGNIYIPGRNLVFLTLASCQELPDEVWLGPLIDETNDKATDKNFEFLKRASDVVNYALSPFLRPYRPLSLRFPLAENHWTKENALRWALENGLQKEKILGTVSCWHHDGHLPCGECKQCFKRYMVFKLNGLEEKHYVHPLKSNNAEKFIYYYTNVQNPTYDEAVVLDMMKRLDIS